MSIKSLNSRELAVKVIKRVIIDKNSLTDALTDIPISYPQKDRAFVKQLCFGTIRWWFQLKTILETRFLKKPVNETDPVVIIILCVGLYQLLYLSQPSYAVVNEMVNCAKNNKKIWACGLINKVLRLVIADKEALIQLINKEKSLCYSHPSWLIKKIKKAWSEEADAILNANNQHPPLFLRVNTSKISREKYIKSLDQEGISYQIHENCSSAITIEKAIPVDKIPGFYDGLISVQDLSGQKVVEYLDIQKNHRVLDACAAPGSKTCHILERHPEISTCVAVDISGDRLKSVTENIARLKLSTEKIHLSTADIRDTQSWWDGIPFDRILVDAPCSATGVIRRHPDIKLLRKSIDINELKRIQLEILQKLWPLLAQGGKLVYSTCSILPEENEQTIQAFLSTTKAATVENIHNSWGKNLAFGQQVITGTENRDGFYYAVLKKTV